MDIKEFIIKEEIGEVLCNEELKKHTSYKVGGSCNYFVTPSSIDKLIILLKYIKNNNIKYKIIGNGSNVIFSSKNYDGIIISLSKIDDLIIEGNHVKVGAGHLLVKLSNICASKGLTGLEFASGIPGNVGGAIYMNAGAYKSDMSNVLKTVTYLDDELNLVTLKKEELDFSYRHSVFQENNFVILEATLELQEGNKEEIMNLINDRRKRRMESQPLEYPSAGSVFRNPSDTIFSGKLIEDLGLKGYQIGGAKVSEKHANFIINYDNATAEDIVNLINLIKEKVKKEYDIDLKVEQEIVNFGE
ncbi:MAG: UDP-N-acetylmuramate dehydrogenase [Bacilli bacterium]|nr:UDP-N-acetylmuramate dehydrogenase [Bacilli bacterium]